MHRAYGSAKEKMRSIEHVVTTDFGRLDRQEARKVRAIGLETY